MKYTITLYNANSICDIQIFFYFSLLYILSIQSISSHSHTHHTLNNRGLSETEATYMSYLYDHPVHH